MIGWCAAISEAARTTMRAMIDSLSPTDPILLLGVVDGPFTHLPADVRAWFGHSRESRIKLLPPTRDQRRDFFKDLLEHVERPPNQFPDAVTRKKRVLEVLPVAPPLPPRMPSAAEMAQQQENDARLKAMLTHRLGPVLGDLKKKFKRFTKSVRVRRNHRTSLFWG
jgi:ATPase family AAA domain-containing protein 2